MRVFVYSKKNKKDRIAVIEDVISLSRNESEMIVVDKYGSEYRFSLKLVKSILYQN